MSEAADSTIQALASQLVVNMGAELDENTKRLIGQLLVVSFDGPIVTPEVRTLIEKYYVGSFLLGRRNIRGSGALELSNLTKQLQEIAERAGYQQPLLIGIDQENGMISRFGDGVRGTHFPGSMAVGATRQINNAYNIAKATALELSAVGINWMLAPVLDAINPHNASLIGVRSFGEDPNQVARFVSGFVDGLRFGGVASSAGHFPSTGGVPDETQPGKRRSILQVKSEQELDEYDFVPLKRVIEGGVDSIRLSSSLWSEDPQNIAEAKNAIHQVLRTKLGHKGVVMVDCTDMPSWTLKADIGEAIELAISAGCDMVQVDGPYQTQAAGIEALYAAVRTERVSKANIEESAGRVQNLKASYLKWEKVKEMNNPMKLSTLMLENSAIARKVYEESITVVRDIHRNIPLGDKVQPQDGILLLTPVVRPLHPTPAGDYPVDPFECFGKALATRHRKIWHAPYNVHGISQMHLALMKKAGAVIFVTCNALRSRGEYQVHSARSVASICSNKPVINIAVCDPYDLLADQSLGTYICTYEYTKMALETTAAIIFGERYHAGMLPISIPGSPSRRQQRKWSVEVWDKRRDLYSSADLWKDCLGAKWPLDTTTLKNLLDRPGYGKHFVVRNPVSNDLLGLAVTYTVHGQGAVLGSLAVLIVRPTHRNLGIGMSLHDVAIRYLTSIENMSSMQLGSIFPRFFPGLPVDLPPSDLAWFAKRGWNLEDKFIYDLYMKIDHLREPTDVINLLKVKGVSFHPCPPERFPELLEFVTTYFSNYPGWVEKYANLRDTPEDIQDVVIALLNDRIVGAALVFSAVGDSQICRDIPWPAAMGDRNGGLACVSVHHEYRSMGLGLGLIYHSMMELRRRNVLGCFVDWVDWNEYDGTYRVLGFQEWGRYREIWRK